jgi:hypothetical protein
MLAGLNYVGIGYFVLYPIEQQWTSITFWIVVGWIIIRSIILLAILFLLLHWIRAGASIWLKIAASSPSPQRAYRVALLVACYVLGVVLGKFALIMNVVSQDIDLPVPKISLILVNLGTDPFLLIAFICFWLYPLSAWFWSKRTTTVSTARWAFLRYPAVLSPPEQVVPLPAFTSPGLALAIGLAGGLMFCILLLLYTLFLHLPISQEQSILLAVLVQGGLAVIMAVRVRQFGELYGLFTAFVGGCVMTGVVFGMSMLATGTIPADIVAWYIFLSIMNQGALLALPVGYASSVFTGFIYKVMER